MTRWHDDDDRPDETPAPAPDGWRIEDALHIDAPAAPAAAKLEAVRAAALELDEDEIVELSVKPSLWYIPLASFRTVVAVILLGAVTWSLGNHGDTPRDAAIWLLLSFTLLGRVAWASLTWASRHYMLTNRRVIRFTGVLRADVISCPLRRVRQVRLEPNKPAIGLGLGRIRTFSGHEPAQVILWDFLAKPDEIYAKLARAVKRGQGE